MGSGVSRNWVDQSCEEPFKRAAKLKSRIAPSSMSMAALRPSRYSMRYAAGCFTSFRSSPDASRFCVRPSATVSPSGVSLRESAEASRSFGTRPSSRAFQTASPSNNCTALTPVSPPRRRSTMHCRPSSAWKSIASEPPSPTISADSISHPDGSSMEGRRHVTGREDPPSSGKCSRREVSTIAFAFSKL